MMRLFSRHIPFLVLICVLALPTKGAAQEIRQPAERDKCPVCGMFVAKYPDWVGQVSFSDGETFFFDGAKDLFKYLHNLGKYAPARSLEDVAAIYVTEYYDMRSIPARDALYVIGSDVYGPMGHELIPFTRMDDARAFLKDHRGKRIVTFQDVTPALVGTLD